MVNYHSDISLSQSYSHQFLILLQTIFSQGQIIKILLKYLITCSISARICNINAMAAIGSTRKFKGRYHFYINPFNTLKSVESKSLRYMLKVARSRLKVNFQYAPAPWNNFSYYFNNSLTFAKSG
jgi:hypothetical protein